MNDYMVIPKSNYVLLQQFLADYNTWYVDLFSPKGLYILGVFR